MMVPAVPAPRITMRFMRVRPRGFESRPQHRDTTIWRCQDFSEEIFTSRWLATCDTTVAGCDRGSAHARFTGPSVQDVWNTTPAWGFPWASSEDAPTPAAAPMIAGGLEQQVAGLGTYALWNNKLYGEFSVYRSAPQGGPHPPDASAENTLRGVAPYWRAALQHSWGSQYVELGTYGMSTRLYPAGVTGSTDRYTDVALDAQYERKVGKGSITGHTTWINETEKLEASVAAGAATNPSNTLKTFKIDGSYYNAGRVGLTVSYFTTSGDADALRYAGSATGSPNSNGVVGEVDFLPWL